MPPTYAGSNKSGRTGRTSRRREDAGGITPCIAPGEYSSRGVPGRQGPAPRRRCPRSAPNSRRRTIAGFRNRVVKTLSAAGFSRPWTSGGGTTYGVRRNALLYPRLEYSPGAIRRAAPTAPYEQIACQVATICCPRPRGRCFHRRNGRDSQARGKVYSAQSRVALRAKRRLLRAELRHRHGHTIPQSALFSSIPPGSGTQSAKRHSELVGNRISCVGLLLV